MAAEIKDIGDIVKKCKILLLDIEGTTTSISFVKDKLFPYAEENVKQFLSTQWESDDVKEAVTALRKLALEDKEKNIDGVVAIPGEDATKEEQIEGLVNNVKWQMSSDRKAGPLKLLQGLIWKQGYDAGDIKGHVYDDVLPALDQWRSVDGQKIYIYSSGSVDAQKLLFGQSLAGDLLPKIDGHFDTAVGAKQEADSYAKIVEKIGCKPEEILFLTDILKEAEAARQSGLHAALVSREGNAPLPADAAFPVIHSLEQLQPTNKRKPDDQEELPAKVPKTDTENDVKTNIEPEKEAKVEDPLVVEEKKESEKTEQMEVEETPAVSEKVTENKTTELPMECAVVEEITDSNDAGDAPVVDIEPIIIEEKDKTDKNETEKMEAEPIETIVSDEPKESTDLKNGAANAPVAEETPPVVEIEEVSEKQDLADVAEIIADLEPVVEEPSPTEEMEDLQNVGEVLEKECDEILSKVNDVTNLDNIPLKPLLKPIVEESMETENADSNDIVQRILDTELELEIKQCDDIDLATVQEITDPKTETVEDKKEKDATSTATTEVPVVEVTKVVETDNETDAKVEQAESSPTETPAETKVEESAPIVEEKEANEETKEVTKEDTKEETKEDTKEETKEDTKGETKEVTKEDTKEENKEETEKEVKEISEEKKEKVEEAKADVEPPVNGKTTNGDVEPANMNGDASKDEELSSRLSVEENGDKVVNGANGDSNGASNGTEPEQPAAKEESAEIKVKTVAVDEPRTDPIDQPTEA